MPDKVVALVPSVVDNDVRISSPEVSKQLVQRRSCELVNTPSPCVKKALFHLERIKLKTNIQKALETTEAGSKYTYDPQKNLIATKYQSDEKNAEELQEEVSQSILKTEGSAVQIRKHLRFVSPPSTPGDDGTDTPSIEALSIRGLGAITDAQDASESMFSKIQLTPQEVFTQVAELLRRLEDDREATERALGHERRRLRSLVQKIDDMSQRRLTLLPIAVQREHEACAADIAELRWHVSFTRRELGRVKEKVSAAEKLNADLIKDIDFVRKHCPLVEEKLAMEKESMKKIRSMQKNVDAELATAKIELDKAEEKYQMARETADRERQQTRDDLEKIRNQLKILQ